MTMIEERSKKSSIVEIRSVNVAFSSGYSEEAEDAESIASVKKALGRLLKRWSHEF